MKRNVWIGTAFLAVLGGLLVAQGFLGRAAMAAGARQAAGAALRSRSVLAEAAAEPLAARQHHRRRRRHARTTSGSSIAAPRRSTTTKRGSRPKHRRVLPGRAAGARVRPGRAT